MAENEGNPKGAKFENDLSKGNVVKQLIIFALPVLFSNIIQSLYSVADMIIVGKFADYISMSGVNIGGQVTFVITNMVFGLAMGATVLVGQYLGLGDKKAVKETIGTLLTALAVLSVVITVVMLFLKDPMLRLIQTPADSYSEAREYFTITMYGTIFIFLYNALSAIMRGMGDSKNPLIFVAVACVTNVILDLVFVAGMGMGAKGAAVATVIAQAVSVILCIIYLKRNDFIFDFKLSSFRFHGRRLKMILKVGIPSSIQNMASGLSFIFLTALVNVMGGAVASAAVGAVGKLNGFAILPTIAMSTSISAMVAQNIGAGEEKRAIKTMNVGMLLSAVITLAIFAVVRIFPEACMRIFIDEEEVIKTGVEYISTFSLDYLLVPYFFCMNGLFMGTGHTMFTLINTCISSILARVPASYIFGVALDWGIRGVGVGAPVATIVSIALCVWYYFSGKWKSDVLA